jgi:hypothetical protein
MDCQQCFWQASPCMNLKADDIIIKITFFMNKFSHIYSSKYTKILLSWENLKHFCLSYCTLHSFRTDFWFFFVIKEEEKNQNSFCWGIAESIKKNLAQLLSEYKNLDQNHIREIIWNMFCVLFHHQLDFLWKYVLFGICLKDFFISNCCL